MKAEASRPHSKRRFWSACSLLPLWGGWGEFFGVTGRSKACLLDHGATARKGVGGMEGLEQQATPFRRARESGGLR